MVKDLYGSLLEELGRSLQIADLHSDRNNSCLIKLTNDVEVQIEINPKNNTLLMGTDLGPLPLGRFRVDLFREALRANGLPYPQHGTFAYSAKTDRMVLFETLSLQDLTGDKISDEMGPFVEKALLWKTSIANNEVPVVNAEGVRASTGMFGLRP